MGANLMTTLISSSPKPSIISTKHNELILRTGVTTPQITMPDLYPFLARDDDRKILVNEADRYHEELQSQMKSLGLDFYNYQINQKLGAETPKLTRDFIEETHQQVQRLLTRHLGITDFEHPVLRLAKEKPIGVKIGDLFLKMGIDFNRWRRGVLSEPTHFTSYFNPLRFRTNGIENYTDPGMIGTLYLHPEAPELHRNTLAEELAMHYVHSLHMREIPKESLPLKIILDPLKMGQSLLASHWVSQALALAKEDPLISIHSFLLMWASAKSAIEVLDKIDSGDGQANNPAYIWEMHWGGAALMVALAREDGPTLDELHRLIFAGDYSFFLNPPAPLVVEPRKRQGKKITPVVENSLSSENQQRFLSWYVGLQKILALSGEEGLTPASRQLLEIVKHRGLEDFLVYADSMSTDEINKLEKILLRQEQAQEGIKKTQTDLSEIQLIHLRKTLALIEKIKKKLQQLAKHSREAQGLLGILELSKKIGVENLVHRFDENELKRLNHSAIMMSQLKIKGMRQKKSK